MIRGDHSERRGEAAAALLRDGYVVVRGALSDLLIAELMTAAEAPRAPRAVRPGRAARPPLPGSARARD